MIRSIQLSVTAIALLAPACERSPAPVPKPDKPRTVQVGEASIYAHEFAGRKTATGEKLDLNAMTAASRTLPLGSHVQVVNKDTGQSANVRINDRGPYVDGRVIDVTPKAAKHIGLDPTDGVAPVAIKAVVPSDAAASHP